MSHGRMLQYALVAVVTLGLLTACTAELQLLTPPPPDSVGGDTTGTAPGDTTGSDTTGGNVQRAALVVTAETVAQSIEDQLVFQDLGWTEGPLAGGEVEASRRGSGDQVRGVTDSAGQVRLTGLLPGTWDVSVLRVLTAEERARLRPERKDVTGFAGGAVAGVAAPEARTTLTAIAGRRGSLVISEVFFNAPLIGDNAYANATYIELYNNADTTIYLDGKLVGRGPAFYWDWGNGARGFLPCSLTTQWQNDSLGLWSPDMLQIPGTGTEYPLPPGGVAVVATDAIDHRGTDPRLPDLSLAAFETIGAADVDNPAVPNARVVVNEFLSFLGRGIVFQAGLAAIFFVADAVDVQSLPWMRPGNYDNRIPRVPREKILDVFASKATVEAIEGIGGDRYCDPFLNRAFELSEGRFVEEQAGFYAISRRSLGVISGRYLLQRTKATRRDFVHLNVLTPGSVP